MMRCFDSQLKTLEASKKLYHKKKLRFTKILRTLKIRVSYLEESIRKMGADFDGEGKVTVKGTSLDLVKESVIELNSSTSHHFESNKKTVSDTKCVGQNDDQVIELDDDDSPGNLTQIFSSSVSSQNENQTPSIRVKPIDVLRSPQPKECMRYSDIEEDPELAERMATFADGLSTPKKGDVNDTNGLALTEASSLSREVHLLCTDGYMHSYILSIIKKKETCFLYGVSCWFTKHNIFNQDNILYGSQNEIVTCRIELDVNAAIMALNTFKVLGVKKVILHTDSKYLSRITLHWLRSNKETSWGKVLNIFKNVKCLETFLILIEQFEDVKIKHEHKNIPEMMEMYSNLLKKIDYTIEN